jgi:hypothetical protein
MEEEIEKMNKTSSMSGVVLGGASWLEDTGVAGLLMHIYTVSSLSISIFYLFFYSSSYFPHSATLFGDTQQQYMTIKQRPKCPCRKNSSFIHVHMHIRKKGIMAAMCLHCAPYHSCV